MAQKIQKIIHPVTQQKVSRCSKHPWVRFRVGGGGCPHCARAARKRANKVKVRITQR